MRIRNKIKGLSFKKYTENFTDTGVIVWLPESLWNNPEWNKECIGPKPQQNKPKYKPYVYAIKLLV